MPQRYTDIQARSWQLALGAQGEVVTDLDDIAQCIRIVVTTPKGSVPHRPDFGTNAFLYLDLPISEAGPHLVRETFEALKIWESRALIERVIPLQRLDGLEVQIVWKPASGEFSQRTAVNL